MGPTRRHCRVPNNVSEGLSDEAQFSDDDDDDFVEDDLNLTQDTDTEKASDCDDSDSNSSVDHNQVLYLQCLTKIEELEKLKKKLSHSLFQKSVKKNVKKKPKDAFTRFSVTYFSKVLAALGDERREIISSYGFSCLLKFDKCVVPNKFAMWLARQVNYKSGDIILKDKVIPLTDEMVHSILELPIGGNPFPAESSVGKSIILNKFNKSAMPQVSFFGGKLINKEAMSDEDVFVCFMMVALSCFLCPNSNLVPSTKYLGIFEDIPNCNKFDFSKYVLQWALDSVKTFNKSAIGHGKPSQTLGGCWYLLAVAYLDFVNFGTRQPPPAIPRTLVWKQNMIKEYSDLDESTSGVYGARPLLDIANTCYSKKSVFLHTASTSLFQNEDFKSQLDINSGFKLPDSLKHDICKLLDDHSINSSLTINMDITSFGNMSTEMKATFSALLEHSSSVDIRTQTVVLKLLKLLCDFCPAESATGEEANDNVNESTGTPNHTSTPQSRNANSNRNLSPINETGPSNSQPAKTLSNSSMRAALPEKSHRQAPSTNCQAISNEMNCDTRTPVRPNIKDGRAKNSVTTQATAGNCQHRSEERNSEIRTPLQPNRKMSDQHVDFVMQKLNRNENENIHSNTPSGKGYTPRESCSKRENRKHKSRMHLIGDYITETDIAEIRNPLADISNDVERCSEKRKKYVSFAGHSSGQDVIPLDDDDDFDPGSKAPSPKRKFQRFPGSKKYSEFDGAMEGQSLEENHCKPTPNLASTQPKFSGVPKSLVTNKQNVSPDIQILGETNVFGRANKMYRTSENLYNSNLRSVQNEVNEEGSKSSSEARPQEFFDTPDNATSNPNFLTNCSTSGGKLPHYGPRRNINAPLDLHGGYVPNNVSVNGRVRFSVNKLEQKNYDSICSLASSKWKDHNAVDIGKVHCTFKSFGESMMPGGHISNFVIAVYCRYLFMKPNGHPDQSKNHYFFSSIADNLLLPPEVAKQGILKRAFNPSSARPLYKSDLLFYPVLFENHWFLFIVDIKDQRWVFLDSYYSKNDDYQRHVRETLIPNFIVNWDTYVEYPKGEHPRDMKFDQYKVLYPQVPRQNNLDDCGISMMMCMDLWKSPRTVLPQLFSSAEIPRIRIKLANDLMFFHANIGMKRLVFGSDNLDDEDEE